MLTNKSSSKIKKRKISLVYLWSLKFIAEVKFFAKEKVKKFFDNLTWTLQNLQNVQSQISFCFRYTKSKKSLLKSYQTVQNFFKFSKFLAQQLHNFHRDHETLSYNFRSVFGIIYDTNWFNWIKMSSEL